MIHQLETYIYIYIYISLYVVDIHMCICVLLNIEIFTCADMCVYAQIFIHN